MKKKLFSELIGKPVFLRGLVQYHLGILRKVLLTHYVLTDVLWIENTGNYQQCHVTGTVDKAHFFLPKTQVSIDRGTAPDVVLWPFPLPRIDPALRTKNMDRLWWNDGVDPEHLAWEI